MPDRALIKKMVVFLRDATTVWARLAEQAELVDKHDEALRARSQEAHCKMEVARLLAAYRRANALTALRKTTCLVRGPLGANYKSGEVVPTNEAN